MIEYKGETYPGDKGALDAAEAWCSDPSNQGWSYTGKYTLQGGETEYSYFFEV
jgi:hypothetical protein